MGAQATEERVGGAMPPALYGLDFIPGCNTPVDVRNAQARINLARDIPWLVSEPVKDRPLIVVGGGPSLKKRWEEVREIDGDILALNNAYPFLVERGVVPTYFMLLDARLDNIETVRKPHVFTRHYLAMQCHPDVYDALAGYDTRLYLTSMEDVVDLVAPYNRPKLVIGGPVGTVGMKALSLGYALGYRDVHLFGYDSSQDNGQHHAYDQKWNDGAKMLDVYIGDMRFTTSPSMAMQVAQFPRAVQTLQEKGCTFELHCDGLLPYYVSICNTLGEAPLEVREREKYLQMWEVDAYRNTAPGEYHVENAKACLAICPGDSVADFGCGTGRAAKAFQDSGCYVVGFDFAPNALEVDIPFVETCLWELPAAHFDWGFCTDVMEHIPPEKVEEVLRRISANVRGCYFNISTEADNLGKHIGRVLHLTCMPAWWWEAEIMKAFDSCAVYKVADGAVTIVAWNTSGEKEMTNGA